MTFVAQQNAYLQCIMDDESMSFEQREEDFLALIDEYKEMRELARAELSGEIIFLETGRTLLSRIKNFTLLIEDAVECALDMAGAHTLINQF